ncbi:MAG: AgmX/PglI C-terminal domain-containing protein [Myxococcota bacterium]|nr:AgmX/PglI C-terminal domain-containing protein [Myxococcota bacterium]
MSRGTHGRGLCGFSAEAVLLVLLSALLGACQKTPPTTTPQSSSTPELPRSTSTDAPEDPGPVDREEPIAASDEEPVPVNREELGTLHQEEQCDVHHEYSSIMQLPAAAGSSHTAAGGGLREPFAGQVGLADVDFLGKEAEESVLEAVTRYNRQSLYCYEKHARHCQDLAGEVVISVSIGQGRAQSSTVLRNTTEDAELGNCIADKVLRWSFDADIEMTVNVPYLLSQ